MHSTDFYSAYSDEAFNKIKRICDSYIAEPFEQAGLALRSYRMFDFTNDQYDSYQFKLKECKQIAYQMAIQILLDLLKEKGVPVQAVMDRKGSIIALTTLSSAGKTLVFFKEYGINHRQPLKQIKDMMTKTDSSAYAYVSFVTDYAYTEDLGHNDTDDSPDKGTNIFSFRHFFSVFLGEEEYQAFEKSISAFTKKTTSFLGTVFLRALVPSNLYSFKRKLESNVRSFPYRDNLSSDVDDNSYKKIWDRFYNGGLYKGLLGHSDYSQSFITAEWLYSSFKDAGKIDYTVVAMGYFKAIEQIMTRFVLLNTHYGRTIKRRHWRGDTKYLTADNNQMSYVPINDENIEDDRLDTTLGSLVKSFFVNSRNDDLLYNDLDNNTKNSIKEIFRSIAPLRNGYFHKENLEDWDMVVKARTVAYMVFFLILGAYKLTEQEKIELQLNINNPDDINKLKQYIREHRNYLYYFCDVFPDKEFLPIRCWVDYEYSNTGECVYGDIHIGRLAQEEDNILPKEFIPSKVYVGWITPPKSLKNIDPKELFSGPKVLIFENGKYCAPDDGDYPV